MGVCRVFKGKMSEEHVSDGDMFKERGRRGGVRGEFRREHI